MAGKASRSSAKISSNTEPSQVELMTLSEHEEHLSSTFTSAPFSTVSPHLTGWRLHLTTVGILLSLFLANLEVTIISTSLVVITDDLKSFSQTSWIMTGYLITYTAFIIIWAKLSDIFGRKSTINTALLIFTAFSTGCGASQTMAQLIICRTFQGIGAAGTYAMTVLTIYEMVPKAKLAIYAGLASITIACATSMGVLLGGLIDDHVTWRWVFFLNLPAGASAMALLFLAMPTNFPNHVLGSVTPRSMSDTFSQGNLQRLDFVGAALLLGGSLLLVTGLLEASIRFSWSSGVTIALLVLSALSWTAFFAWEWYVTSEERKQEPVFPWRFFGHRPLVGMLITTFLVGVPFNFVVVTLPQYFQAVSRTTTLGAGIRLLPYMLSVSLGALAANIIGAKGKVPPVYLLFVGALLQVLGLALLSTLPISGVFPAEGYGYETLAGAGVGVTFGILILATPFVAEARDLAVATGAIVQFRFLGGAIGLAVASSIMNSYLKVNLAGILSPSELAALLQSTEVLTTFRSELQERVREVFVQSYDIQFKVVTGIAAAQFPCCGVDVEEWRAD